MSEDKTVRRLRKQLETALAKRNDDEAAELLGKLMDADPKVPRWPHKRGDLLRKLGKTRLAIDCYASAATLYADQGFLARAIAMAKTILNLDPQRIDVLERVDPEAARKLHRMQRPKTASEPQARPPSGPGRHPAVLDDDFETEGPDSMDLADDGPAIRHPAILPDDDALPPARPMRHPAILPDDDEPAAPAMRHPAVLPDDDEPPARPMRHPAILPDDDDAGLPVVPAMRHPAVLPDDDEPPARPMRHPAILPDDEPIAAPKRHPMVLDDAPPLPPPPAAGRAPARGAAGAGRGALALDRLSDPPPRRGAAAPPAPAPRRGRGADLLSESVLDLASELTVAPDINPERETRFSNAPPARPGLSHVDVALRAPALPPLPSSLPPPPPSPKQLSKLPLFPLFAEVPKQALGVLVQGAEVIELQDGDLVMRKGEISDSLYGIVEGSVVLSVPGHQAKVTLAEGDVFGESMLLAGEKHHADVTVKGYLVVLRIARPVLNQLLAAHPPLAEVLLELLTRRLLANLLQASPLFQEFDMRGRQEIVRLFEVRRAPANTLLAEAGKAMDGLYINLTGELEVTRSGAPPQRFDAGHMFGHGCMLTHGRSEISVRALSNMLVLRLPASAFANLAMQYPAILAQVSDMSGAEVARVG